MPARHKSHTIAGSSTELKELLGRGFAICLLLDYRCLECLLALKIGQHQFAELHELLNFLLRDLAENLQRLYRARFYERRRGDGVRAEAHWPSRSRIAGGQRIRHRR